MTTWPPATGLAGGATPTARTVTPAWPGQGPAVRGERQRPRARAAPSARGSRPRRAPPRRRRTSRPAPGARPSCRPSAPRPARSEPPPGAVRRRDVQGAHERGGRVGAVQRHAQGGALRTDGERRRPAPGNRQQPGRGGRHEAGAARSCRGAPRAGRPGRAPDGRTRAGRGTSRRARAGRRRRGRPTLAPTASPPWWVVTRRSVRTRSPPASTTATPTVSGVATVRRTAARSRRPSPFGENTRVTAETADDRGPVAQPLRGQERAEGRRDEQREEDRGDPRHPGRTPHVTVPPGPFTASPGRCSAGTVRACSSP